jgi:hypothetical protein
MRHPRRWQASAGVGIFATSLVLCVTASTAPALAAGASGLAASASATGPASTKPANGTPNLAKTKTVQIVRQIVQCGSTMYAVGHVWKLKQNGNTYNRDDVFSFSAKRPYTMTGLDPHVVGQVNSIAFINNNCADAYIGGSFTSVNGTSATNIAEISTANGALVSGFGHDANNEVDTLLGYKDELLAGGKFTELNGSSQRFFDSLSPSTGTPDSFVSLDVKGHVYGMAPVVYNQQLSHGGTLDLVEGNFTSVGGHPRQQIFMLNLAGTTATVTGWTSSEFSQHCIGREAFYVRSAAWGPGDTTVYVADTGDHLKNRKIGSFPLTGLCDAAAAFPATQKSVTSKWIEYTGCDSYYSVAADNGAVYVGGHPRWAENPNGCNKEGPGAIPDQGLQGLNPANGTLLTNSSGKPEYHMSRANGDSMLITSAGLWIGSSNRFGARWCQNSDDHAGVCLLPY